MTNKSSPNSPTFTLREPQKPAQSLLNTACPNILFAGSSRVGKSLLITLNIRLLMEMYPGSRHGIFRRHRNSCEKQLFKTTLPQALTLLGTYKNDIKGMNKSDLSLTLDNGSIMLFGGLDENDKEKELGSEYQTIWMNETTQFEYEDVEFMRGRLNGDVFHKATGHKLPHRMLFDCNPGTFDDWEYKLFHQKIQPITNKPLIAPEDYEYVRMITDDQEYIRRNIDQSDEWKERFIYANWTASNPNALFNRRLINEHRYSNDLDSLRFKNVVVGVDPHAVATATSDLTGIVVAGITYDNQAYVLADYSTNIKDWETEVIRAFDEWQADLIVAERNNGGDMVEKVIRQARRNAPVETVFATRNKEMRADPVAQRYRAGDVHHAADLTELESEMVAFDPANARRKSPDRMDAMVWALWKLFDIGGDTKQQGTVNIKRNRAF